MIVTPGEVHKRLRAIGHAVCGVSMSNNGGVERVDMDPGHESEHQAAVDAVASVVSAIGGDLEPPTLAEAMALRSVTVAFNQLTQAQKNAVDSVIAEANAATKARLGWQS